MKTHAATTPMPQFVHEHKNALTNAQKGTIFNNCKTMTIAQLARLLGKSEGTIRRFFRKYRLIAMTERDLKKEKTA